MAPPPEREGWGADRREELDGDGLPMVVFLLLVLDWPLSLFLCTKRSRRRIDFLDLFCMCRSDTLLLQEESLADDAMVGGLMLVSYLVCSRIEWVNVKISKIKG